MEFTRFNPSAHNFPRPRVSLLPLKPALDWRKALTIAVPPSPTFKSYSRGRYALGQAYRLAGIGANGDLLAPAYHCVTMLDPALDLGAHIRLYPLRPNLQPDLNALALLLSRPGNPVKALLATHFFGVEQDFGELKTWCESRGIRLIEDCSHVLFTENHQAGATGKFGRFVTASPYKFFACEDGGLLHCRDESVLRGVLTRPPGLLAELRALKHGFEKYRLSQTRTQALEINKLDDALDVLCEKKTWPATDEQRASQQASIQFSPEQAGAASLRTSRRIVGASPIAAIAKARRRNYQRWLDGIVGVPNCKPLYPALPESCIPYMFPLYIDTPAPHFFWLKHLGLPIWRWDEMATSDCPVATDYRQHLLHLPCHQSLSEAQLDWMIAAVSKTLRRPAGGNA